jgi:nitrogen fixation NifU-like protein
MFNQTVLDHFSNPRNTGELASATAVVEASNPVCGDVLRLSVRVESGKIAEARFQSQGCVAAIAAGSFLTDLLAGKTAAEAREITPQAISEGLGGLPPASFHAAQLCTDVVAALMRKM